MPTPEELARQTIDAMLAAAGWAVQDYKAFDPSASTETAMLLAHAEAQGWARRNPLHQRGAQSHQRTRPEPRFNAVWGLPPFYTCTGCCTFTIIQIPHS